MGEISLPGSLPCLSCRAQRSICFSPHTSPTFNVFVLPDVDRLQESLGEVGDGASSSGFYIAADNGGNEACQGGAEIAGGEVVAGEEVGQVFAECLGGAGVGFFLGVVEAEVGIIAGARGAAAAAIREREGTQGHAVLRFERGHKSLLRVEFWMLSKKEDRLKPIPPKTRTLARMPTLRTWS